MDGGEMRSTFTSTTGGVMCREVGAITGELEISTRALDEGFEATVRYAGADEWYTVEGSPVTLEEVENRELDDLHGRMMEQLTTPGSVLDGNEQPVSLRNFR